MHPVTRVLRRRGLAALLVAAVGCALFVVVTAWSRPTGSPGAAPQRQDPPTSAAGPTSTPRETSNGYTVMQMNLCLSGLAGCFDAAYPGVLREAVSQIRHHRPDAVTLSEGCEKDVESIARGTGYHMRFATVIYGSAELACVDPGERGVFGNAVLTRASISDTDHEAFQEQAGDIERRRWLCVTTRPALDVCTSHLSTRHNPVAAATSVAQCQELAELLARRAAARAVLFAGDVNRHEPCAPGGFWTRTDGSAGQAPGLQHVYGSEAAFGAPSVDVVPAQYSDHDVLLVRARLLGNG